ncbi:crossover junction endodeoxyribonuclease RuvC, partial [Anaplasma bovis]|uniref:crossover junction endodeoxyribonuclease RuvC n=1 Tax=Anaplasma bovis TaxID=186733 RepID=UPI002FF03A8A
NAISCKSLNEKLYMIFSSLCSILDMYDVKEAAIEKVFVNSNPKSSMYLCYARASTVISLMSKQIEIHEYSATTIKKLVFGNGKASKEQVSFVVKHTFGMNSSLLSDHASDAIATALCHLYNRRSLLNYR